MASSLQQVDPDPQLLGHVINEHFRATNEELSQLRCSPQLAGLATYQTEIVIFSGLLALSVFFGTVVGCLFLFACVAWFAVEGLLGPCDALERGEAIAASPQMVLHYKVEEDQPDRLAFYLVVPHRSGRGKQYALIQEIPYPDGCSVAERHRQNEIVTRWNEWMEDRWLYWMIEQQSGRSPAIQSAVVAPSSEVL